MTADPINVVIVPISYQGRLPKLDNLSYLTWYAAKVLPTSQINFSVSSTTLTFNGDLTQLAGWQALLPQVSSFHASDDPGGTKLYYGLVNSGCPGGSCYAGIGYIGCGLQQRGSVAPQMGQQTPDRQ